ncbi:aconitase X [Agrobacterium salinitolerans]|uniref:Aconitase X n=1 Tax=Agrobacterium salinitolerans TaxID=1183413 RepID=A0A9X3KMH2_9HYPH|nr:aconitase X [Agrobacterium salinitolerans]MCZ7854171.1 aconitase X [Agrobacterium salinitolerans]MCZ7937574.1 aconitase X [Agrobacterium salinitolerans]MCZ7975975.1 aconitase X [Agrobacterium salinitolerans]
MSSSLSTTAVPEARSILAGSAEGPVIATTEALSFWGGVDPATGRVIDVHHPLHGVCLTGGVLFMPTSRGSCTGSGVLLDLILTGRAPSALVFCEAEDVLTLGALIAAEMFGKLLPVLRLDAENFARFSKAAHVRIDETAIEADGVSLGIAPPATAHLDLGDDDRAMLEGRYGVAVQQAMRITVAMAAQQGASALVDVTQGHIDGCIYASPANLTFAEKMAEMGAKVRVPTTMNAISVDKAHWRSQGMPEDFGDPAARLADAYVRMGCRPTFTCSPYLLDSAPQAGDMIAWAESNAVIFANTVLGARTAKHPDFLDLCIALTGRAPLAGVYLEENRRPQRIVNVALPQGVDDAFWPLVGYLAGKAAPDCIPLLRGLGPAKPSRDDLKALCAAFGTTSAAPMLHIEGVTPEAGLPPLETADIVTVSPSDMAAGWSLLNEGPEEVQLVAIGSPHASLEECHALAAEFAGRRRHADVAVIVTAGQQVIDAAGQDGTLQGLHDSGVQVLPDLCWCSISEPVFPTKTRALMTNSGKYAHYGPGLSGRAVRFGSLADCVDSALTGRAVSRLPSWLS